MLVNNICQMLSSHLCLVCCAISTRDARWIICARNGKEESRCSRIGSVVWLTWALFYEGTASLYCWVEWNRSDEQILCKFSFNFMDWTGKDTFTFFFSFSSWGFMWLKNGKVCPLHIHLYLHLGDWAQSMRWTICAIWWPPDANICIVQCAIMRPLKLIDDCATNR